MLIDSHCHLDLIAKRDNIAIDTLVQNAHTAGVQRILSIGIDQPNSEQVYALAQQHEQVYASVGVHPCHANEQPVDTAWLAEWGAKPGVIALGETGLDYYREPVNHRLQWQSFADHLTLAAQLGKPVIVHTRQAQADTIRILQEHHSSGVTGVMHCFTEAWAMAEQALELGFYISISGIVTFKNAEPIREVVRQVPLNRLLIETDAPYLAPVPYRGKTNKPEYVQYVAAMCAEQKQLPVEQLIAATGENFCRLFGLQ